MQPFDPEKSVQLTQQEQKELEEIRAAARVRHAKAAKAAKAAGKPFPESPFEDSWAFEEDFRKKRRTGSSTGKETDLYRALKKLKNGTRFPLR